MRPRLQLRSVSLALALLGACGDPDDDLTMGGNPASSADASLPDSGMPGAIPAQPDASNAPSFDSGPSPLLDAGPRVDAGPGPALVDAGSVDSGAPAIDAGALPDAGGGTDSGGGNDAGGGADAGPCATLTYASFGQQFLTMYCTGCHTGARAPDGVMLDTLAAVQQRKAAIKMQAVTMMAMPPQNPRPSAADRQKLGQWLDCGPM